MELPRTLFECQKLVTLKLNSNMIVLDVPGTVCHESCLKNLLLGCPVLVKLSMIEIFDDSCRLGHGRVVKQNLFVSSPSLKIPRVENPASFALVGNCYVLEAPKLEYLHFVEHCLAGIRMATSPSLVSAVIDICTSRDDNRALYQSPSFSKPSPVFRILN